MIKGKELPTKQSHKETANQVMIFIISSFLKNGF